MPYHIAYSNDAEEHLRDFTAREQAIILDVVNQQLLHQPTTPTRNRKLMRDNPLAKWELRIGNIRVYYQVTDESEPVVDIRAIGIKVGNRVRVAGQEVEW